jgi:two-component system, chemotaxis family, CheB/CheR fusion protein
MLSHELRNPLGAIVSATALLKSDGGIRKDPSRLVGILERQSQQMARLLDDLLEASRVTQNKIELRRRIVDLGTVARDAADAVRSQLDAREIKLTVDIESRPLAVFGDPARLQQIQVNLLSNAAKYTQRGGHVQLSVKQKGETVEVRVRDDGAGIPADMLASVFELFVQSHRTLDRSAGGLGLGLTIVRSLVAMHGGTVQALSDGEGKGSEFIVTLPLWDGVTIEEPPRSRSNGGDGALRSLPERAKVVIVEDNADSREAMCQLLELAGYDCQTAESGLEGLELIERTSPHVAILDVGLPGMNGYEIARRLRAKHSQMTLIAITGYGQAHDREASREAGFDAHLVKPVDSQQLLSMLDRMRTRGKMDGAAPSRRPAPPEPEAAD